MATKNGDDDLLLNKEKGFRSLLLYKIVTVLLMEFLDAAELDHDGPTGKDKDSIRIGCMLQHNTSFLTMPLVADSSK